VQASNKSMSAALARFQHRARGRLRAHGAGSARGSPSTGRRKFERRIEVRCVFHVVRNVGRAAPRRGALRRCWKFCTKKTTDVVPEFCKAPLKYSDGAVDGGHYYYALYLGNIYSLFASHRTSLVRHRSHSEGSQRGRQAARKRSSAQARKTSSARCRVCKAPLIIVMVLWMVVIIIMHST